jgi:uncharacterized membrane protein YcaP (DUF421 family)
LDDWVQVKEAFMESDGHISVVPYEKKQRGGAKRKEK